ncbi:hypothetical protein [Streptomyces sp. NPDC058268]|uniref:hypothetical protein n=1 Tax=Streptomyces sp. NPDC058268 TaxID=3346413 RepID=UPI0036E2CC05
MRGTSPHPAFGQLRLKRLLLAVAGLALALVVLQLAVASPATGLLVCAVGAFGGLALWLRRNRTAATAVVSTAATMMWIPYVIERVGRAAGVPEAIASWEVLPLWALTLAVLAGAWLPARHTGSRAVTVLLAHLAISGAACAAAVFPATALTAAAVAVLAVLALRSSAPAACRMRLQHLQARVQKHPSEEGQDIRDDLDRLWLTAATRGGVEVFVGQGGQLAVLHQLPRGRITLERVDDGKGNGVKAYVLDGSATKLTRALTDFALDDRLLARSLNVNTSEVTTLVAAPRAGLGAPSLAIDLAGIWDKTAHRYVDHRAVLLGTVTPTSHLSGLAATSPRKSLSRMVTSSTRRDRRAKEQRRYGDARQRRIAAILTSRAQAQAAADTGR